MEIVDAKQVDPGFVPLCPHCEKVLHQIVRLSDEGGKGFFDSHDGYAYACPYCRKILGFADFSS